MCLLELVCIEREEKRDYSNNFPVKHPRLTIPSCTNGYKSKAPSGGAKLKRGTGTQRFCTENKSTNQDNGCCCLCQGQPSHVSLTQVSLLFQVSLYASSSHVSSPGSQVPGYKSKLGKPGMVALAWWFVPLSFSL